MTDTSATTSSSTTASHVTTSKLYSEVTPIVNSTAHGQLAASIYVGDYSKMP